MRVRHPLSVEARQRERETTRRAEQDLLGAVMLAGDRALDRVDLGPDDFGEYRHREIFRAMQALRASGKPCGDPVLLEGVLGERIASVGGLAYLAQLGTLVPTAENVEYYVAVVREAALTVRVRLALADVASSDLRGLEMVEDAYETLSQFLRASDDATVAMPAAVREAAKELLAALDRKERGEPVALGVPTGFENLDAMLGGLQPGVVTILAGRPSHGKSSLARTLADNAAAAGHGVHVFTLEDSRRAYALRALSDRSAVGLHRIRSITLNRGDVASLVRASDELGAREHWLVDDAAGLSAAQIALRVRRHRRDHATKLVVVDYVQLMREPGARDTRDEVDRAARGLVELARGEQVAMLLLSQLNRECERRDDKRPILSDLRECLAGDQLVVDAATGVPTPIRDIALRGTVARVHSLDHTGKIQTVCRGPAWSSGVKPILKVTTATGRSLRCSPDHPVLMYSGWRKAGGLRPGDRIAVPRRLPPPVDGDASLSKDEAALLGFLISDGSYLLHRTVSYTKADDICVDEVARIARERFSIAAREKPRRGAARELDLCGPGTGPGSNPLINWLKALGVHGQRGRDKRIPEALWRSGNDVVAAFVGALWAGDGTVTRDTLKFCSTSRGLLADLQMLLTRLGVVAGIGNAYRNSKSTMPLWTIAILNRDQILAFAKCIAIPGVKGRRLMETLGRLRSRGSNPSQDLLPMEVTERVAQLKAAAGLSWEGLGYRCQGKRMSRGHLAAVASRLGDQGLTALAQSDILWDEVAAVVPDGVEETFDINVPGPCNLVVNNVITHNSGTLEQLADAVLCVYRDEVYDEASEHKGIAEVLVRKNKHGRTGSLRFAWDAECATYRPLATGRQPPRGANGNGHSGEEYV